MKTLTNAEGEVGKYAVPRNESKKDIELYNKETDEIEAALKAMKLKHRVRIEPKIRTGEVEYRNGKFYHVDDEDGEGA